MIRLCIPSKAVPFCLSLFPSVVEIVLCHRPLNVKRARTSFKERLKGLSGAHYRDYSTGVGAKITFRPIRAYHSCNLLCGRLSAGSCSPLGAAKTDPAPLSVCK